MCGIVGYIGGKEAQPILLNGLKRLEYRGYDSAGICTFSGETKTLSLCKLPGKVKALEQALNKNPLRGSLGIGHCLSPDTFVFLANGEIIPISKIADGQQVLSLNLKTKKLEPAEVRVSKHASPEYLYDLRTSFSSLKCTAQHRMFIASGDEIIEKKAEDIKKGDMLLVPMGVNIKEEKMRFKSIFVKRYFRATQEANRLIKTRLLERQLTKATCASSAGISEAYLGHIYNNDRNFREDELHKLLASLSLEFNPSHFIPKNTIHGKFITLPEQSSPELMQIIGYLLGDGTVKERCARFKDLDKELLCVYQGLIEKVFNIKGRIVPMRGTRAWLLEANSFYLCQWLKDNIVNRKEDFLNELGKLPHSEMAAFLRGLFDAEGCVNLKSIQLTLRITNAHLVKISQFLLLRCGIPTSFYTQKKQAKNWKDTYAVSLNNFYSFEKFKTTVGFSSKRKTEKLEAVILKKARPYRCKNFQDLHIIPQAIFEIKKVKSEDDFLFDLEVDHPDANFIANGAVSHNSRWATHGIPSEKNAHPHMDCKGKLAVVHNGIIENYQELKKRLKKEGHKFASDTDTEVIPHLIEKFYKGDLEKAVQKTIKLLKGTYAIAVIHKDEPGTLVGARSDSPLIVGFGKDEKFLASDAPAVLDYTKDVIFLDNHETVALTRNSVVIRNHNGRRLNRKPTRIKWDIGQAEKAGYSHFMLKEIFEQGDILEKIIEERLNKGKVIFEELKISADEFRRFKRIAIVACGTAYHAGLTGKYMLEELVNMPCWVDTSSEFRYRNPMVGSDTLVIIISQSGETADSLAALREAKHKGAAVLGICNVLGSSIARESDGVIYTHAGPEIAVASTKAYTAQLSILYLLTLYLGRLKKTIPPAKYRYLVKELVKVPELVKELLSEYKGEYNLLSAYAQEFKRYYHEKQNKSCFLYLARHINVPNALEGALKLKEISYISAEGYPAGEMKHGPIALIDENPWVVCIATKSKVYDKMLSNIQEIKARSGIVIAIATEGDKEILHHNINYLIEVPAVDEIFSPLLVVIPLQLLAYYVAREFGYDIDQPRNLAKSVTVE